METVADEEAPALSVTVTVIVYVPVAYACAPVHVPAPPLSVTAPVDVVPSPHAILHVCVSAVPASLNDALSDTLAPALKRLPVVGVVIFTLGATFATVTEKVPLAEAPVESV